MSQGPVRSEVVEQSNDILVSIDLLNQVIADPERLRVDEAILLRHTAESLRKKAKETIDALDLHLVDVMEAGDFVNYKGWQYRKGTKKEHERFDHDEIGRRVRALALDRAPSMGPDHRDGVLDGAAEAIQIMRDIYLSESSDAKVTQLDRYGIPRWRRDDSVQHWEPGAKYIDVSPIQSEVQQ